MNGNQGMPFCENLLNNYSVNYDDIYDMEKRYLDELEEGSLSIYKQTEYQTAWLLRAISCIDLTTLSGDDIKPVVNTLCLKAMHPISDDILAAIGANEDEITCAAVCVYPNMVKHCALSLSKDKRKTINIASVAAGFPAGQTPLSARLLEIEDAVANGANEIDVVLNRNLALLGKWEEVYDEISEMRKSCNKLSTEVHLKVILATGDLRDFNLISKASMVAMMAGADFIKTSTGKESINATITSTIIMLRCIKDYEIYTNVKIGYKPAGGIRTYNDALLYLRIVTSIMGTDFIKDNRFRIGASSLLDSIVKRIEQNINL